MRSGIALLRRAVYPAKNDAVVVLSILLLAFGLRLLARLATGEPGFWSGGYSSYYTMAVRWLEGAGFCRDVYGLKCAYRPPVYPLFLAATTLAGGGFLSIVVPQAVIGAGTAVCSFLIARLLFTRPAAVLAGLFTAAYPYYVLHDTALQETSLFTLLTACAVLFLLRAVRSTKSTTNGALAGTCLGLAVLTRESLASFVPMALLWVTLAANGAIRSRLRRLLAVGLPCSLLLSLWLVRTYLVVGAPMLSSHGGLALWIGNNPYTFSHYPVKSIDLSENEARQALTLLELREIEVLADDEVAQSAWFARKGLDYIRDHPWQTAGNAVWKLEAAFSCALSPRRETVYQLAHGLAYCPILILGVLGAWLTRRDWRTHSLLYLLFLSFAATTVVFWAHTSHRSFLDVYLQVFAAAAAARLVGLIARALGSEAGIRPDQAPTLASVAPR